MTKDDERWRRLRFFLRVRILAGGAELINQLITKTARNSYTGGSLFYVEPPAPQESVTSNLVLQ